MPFPARSDPTLFHYPPKCRLPSSLPHRRFLSRFYSVGSRRSRLDGDVLPSFFFHHSVHLLAPGETFISWFFVSWNRASHEPFFQVLIIAPETLSASLPFFDHHISLIFFSCRSFARFPLSVLRAVGFSLFFLVADARNVIPSFCLPLHSDSLCLLLSYRPLFLFLES